MKLSAETLLKQIASFKRKTFTPQVLMKKLGASPKEKKALTELLHQLESQGKIFAMKSGGYGYSKAFGYQLGEMVRVNATYGFARPEEAEEDVFIPGRLMMGALAGDTVLLKEKPGRGNLKEAEVIAVVSRSERKLSGNVIEENGRLFVEPDGDMHLPLSVAPHKEGGARPGDKVLFRIAHYGKSHFAHRVEILRVFGQADSAANCAEAVLASHDVSRTFPEEVARQAWEIGEAGIHPKELEHRRDLRDMPIFTIDGADTKDIDDAVSVEERPDGWRLGVHIADVSYYVTPKSPLDEEAYERGTSIYFADSVIPMLPPELSNGICSLNPGEDRLAFSCFIDISPEGEMTGYELAKTVIRSRVKGVYQELNDYLDGRPGEGFEGKYREVLPELGPMVRLYHLLRQRHFDRGAINLESTESKIIVGPDGRAVDIKKRVQGETEQMIEEFMLMANQAVATFAIEKELPFVFRVHEYPPEQKVTALKETLTALNIDNRNVKLKSEPAVLAGILESVKGTQKEQVVNALILRSMAKARYDSQNLGHYGLVLKNYCHFTSPIRRYADLAIHRILSAFLAGSPLEKIQKRFGRFAADAAAQASQRELVAVEIERDCEDCYKAEYMSRFIGYSYDGVISGAANQGLYVELENSVEGLVAASRLPDGMEYDGAVSFANGPDHLTVGQPLRVKVLSCNIPMGHVDFDIAYSD